MSDEARKRAEEIPNSPCGAMPPGCEEFDPLPPDPIHNAIVRRWMASTSPANRTRIREMISIPLLGQFIADAIEKAETEAYNRGSDDTDKMLTLQINELVAKIANLQSEIDRLKAEIQTFRHVAKDYTRQVETERDRLKAELDRMTKEKPLLCNNVRLLDLVRYMRAELHEQDLITDDEYAALCTEVPAGSPRRLEDYDAMKAERDALKTELEKLKEDLKGSDEMESLFQVSQQSLRDKIAERDALKLKLEACWAMLEGIIDGCVHPETAHRRVMLDLAPIRALLTAQKGQQ